jgi:predicted Zn-dependent protease
MTAEHFFIAYRVALRYLYNMRTIVVLFLSALMTFTESTLGQVKTVSSTSAGAAAAPDYSAESAVVEQLDTVYRFAADGTATKEITGVIHIQSDAAARQQYGILNFAYAGDSERVEIAYVRARKVDGSVVETPSSDAQEMPLEITRQAPFYSDLKDKQVPVRNLAIGDRLEYKVKIIDSKAEVPGEFWGQEIFARGAVVLSQTFELHVPKTKYVKVWSPEHPPTKTEAGDEIVYRWTGSQTEPTVGKDGKTIQQEIEPRGELPSIAWTTFKSWDAIGAWYRGLEADRIVPDAMVKAKAAEVIASKTTDAEKAQALYSYVATQIRYIGVAFGIGRYQPHAAAEVLRNQYGDCKDKHTLLAAMLTASGLHPEAVLIGAGIRLNEDVPSPAAFNHMITQVPVAGAPVWLDTTSELAPYQMLLQVIRDKQALVIPETGAAKLEKTPAGLPFTPFTKFVAKGTLNKDGLMKAQMEYTTRGDDEVVMRTLLRQVPRGQWNDLMQRLSQGFGFSGTTSNPDAARPDATGEPVRISYDYEREKTGDWDNRRIVPLFPVVFITNVDGKNPPKKIPIELGEPRVETSISVIKLPAGWGADLPAAVHQKTAFASFDKTYKVEGGTLTTERRIEVLQRQVPAAEWKAYKKWYDASLGDGENWVTLTEPDAIANSSPAPRASDDANANVLRMAAVALGRNDLKTAREELDIVKASKPDQPGLWRMYSMLDSKEGKEEAATDDLVRELKTHPDQVELYSVVIEKQLQEKRRTAAKETLKFQIEHQPEATSPALTLAQLLVQDGQPGEAIAVLEAASKRAPDDSLHGRVMAQLGGAQLKAGEKEKAEATLGALLRNTNDPGLLNDAAYALANASLDLDLAEKSAGKAVDTLSAQSSSWTLDGDVKTQTATTRMILSAWDTIGWVLFRQGKLDEAKGYIQATWQSRPSSEVGLHLGQIFEAQRDKRTALGIYLEAQQTNRDSSKDVTDELKRRIDVLIKAGVVLSDKEKTDLHISLEKSRINNPDHVTGIADYEILLSGGKSVDVRSMRDAATHIAGGEAKISGSNFTNWTPPGSTAKLRLRALLNCHHEACTLERLPL